MLGALRSIVRLPQAHKTIQHPLPPGMLELDFELATRLQKGASFGHGLPRFVVRNPRSDCPSLVSIGFRESGEFVES